MEQMLYWLAGGLGLPLINLVKRVAGLRGKGAVAETATVSGVVATAALLLTRQLDLTSVNADNLMEVFG